jgi:predicted acylesterase/phospholipase RssA
MVSTRFADANLSLCGCGFLCIYHAGVCAALRVYFKKIILKFFQKEYAPQLTKNRIYGASAGSIAAAGLICNISISDATCAIMRVVAEVYLFKLMIKHLNRRHVQESYKL